MIERDDRRAARAPEEPALLSLAGIGKSWAGTPVLRKVGLELGGGQVVGIAGGNGIGKTTLLRIATGMILPDRGVVKVRGVDIERDGSRHRRAIGFLSAGDRGLYARLSVAQNLDFWGGLAGLRRSPRRRRAAAVLSEFDLVELASRRVDRLSMGQRQRVRLAMTFLHEPDVAILDEPTTSLDEAGVALLGAAIERLVGRGGAVLIASPEGCAPFRGRSWLLRDGRLLPWEAGASSEPAPTEPVSERLVAMRG